jgi:hypothetical protein
MAPENLIAGFCVYVTSSELADRLWEQARYLRSVDAARETFVEHPELRGQPDAPELAARLCAQRADLCEFLATHLPHDESLADPESDGTTLALSLEQLNALLPLLGFKFGVAVRQGVVQRPPPGPPPSRGLVS